MDSVLAVEVGQARQTSGTDGGDLLFAERGLVDLDDVGRRSETIFHDELKMERILSQTRQRGRSSIWRFNPRPTFRFLSRARFAGGHFAEASKGIKQKELTQTV